MSRAAVTLVWPWGRVKNGRLQAQEQAQSWLLQEVGGALEDVDMIGGRLGKLCFHLWTLPAELLQQDLWNKEKL